MDTNHNEFQISEIPEQNIITFEEGILGFEDMKKYLLYHEDDNNIIWSLQAAEAEVPSFIVVDPYTILNNYAPALSQADFDYFEEQDASNLCFLVIAVIKPNLADSVANLKAPIIINVRTKRAKQIILDNSDYPIRYKLFDNNENKQ